MLGLEIFVGALFGLGYLRYCQYLASMRFIGVQEIRRNNSLHRRRNEGIRQTIEHGRRIQLLEVMPTTTPKNVVDSELLQCSICLSNYEEDDVIRVLVCGHHFHKSCCDAWLVANPSCPVCRSNPFPK